MSTVQNTLIWRVVATGGGQVVGTFNQIGSSFGRLGQQINQNSMLSERLNSQWRAFGTTIRYAIAGGTIFGLTRMASELKDIQTQLGLIAAIASQPGPGGGLVGVPFSGQQISQLRDQLRGVSTETLTPLRDVNAAALNFLSTVQGVPQDQLSPMLESITRGAKLAQTPTEDLTKAITTMNIAFGQANNIRNIQQGVQRWFSLIQLAPGGVSAAPEIVQQLAPVAAVARLQPGVGTTGREAQAQMMALMLGAVRTGATPSTAGRGLSFLIQSILQPKTKEARSALASMGITPEFTHREGFWPSLMKLFQNINFKGDPKALAAIPDDQLEEMGTSALKGLNPQQAELLNRAIPRIHGVRTAVILASQLQQHGQVQSLAQDYQIMLGHFTEHDKDVLLINRAWERFRKQARLEEAVNAIHNMQVQVAQTFLPVLNFAARGAIGLEHQARAHPTATRAITIAMAAAIGGYGINRFFRAGGQGGLLNFLRRGGSGAGSAIVRSQAVTALANTGVLGGSPLNPMYVVVVDQLFGPNVPGPTGPATPPGDVPKAAERGSRLGRLFRKVPLVTGAAAVTAAGAYGFAQQATGFQGAIKTHIGPIDDFNRWIGFLHENQNGKPRSRRFQTPLENALQEPYLARRYKQYEIERARKLESPYVTDVRDFRVENIKGRAVVEMTLKIEQPGKKVQNVGVSVPMDLWTRKAPGSRGQPGKTKRR